MDNAARHLISPNLHVILVHFPLGIFVFGLFLEVFGLVLWKRSSAMLAAKWMILIGGLMSVPAALTGLDAYFDMREHMTHDVKVEGMRKPMQVKGLSDQQWDLLEKHILWASIGAGLAALGVTVGLGLSGTLLKNRLVYFLLLLILMLAAAFQVYGSHFGGEGVYLGGVAVQVQEKAFAQLVQNSKDWWVRLEWYAPARSTHILLAGFAMAAALAALGASWRLVAVHGANVGDVDADKELAALAAPDSETQPPRRVTDDLSVARSLNAEAEMGSPRIPSARFWLLSFLLFLAALAVGIWWLTVTSNLYKREFAPRELTSSTVAQEVWQKATSEKKILDNRDGFHIGLGIVLVIFPLVLAIAVRWMYRAKWVVGTMLILMALLIAAQIWIGVLMVFRGHHGEIYKFPRAQTTQSEV